MRCLVAVRMSVRHPENADESMARHPENAEDRMAHRPTCCLTRREWCAGLGVALGGLAAGACATVSPREERDIGRKEAEEVKRTIGLVNDPKAVQYVNAIGARLARTAARPDIAWQFAVADQAEANAFALPGGWVYVTRGLLALTNREDELAGVLGHEMAHVTERHATSRVSAATPLAILFGVPSGILGTVSPTLGGIVGGAGRVVTGLALAPYSRDQEREADRVGIALAARAGWDPAGLAAFLRTLERAETLAGAGAAPSQFFATHPATPERVANVEAMARSLSRTPVAEIAGTRPLLLERLEGLVVGENAAHGVFVKELFLHADFDLSVEMPAGWKTANSPDAAGAAAPEDGAVVLLQLVGAGGDPVAAARAEGLSETQVQRIRRLDIARLPAATLTASTRDGERVSFTWIAHRQRVFRVTGVCRERDSERYGDVFTRTAATFRPLRPEDRRRIVLSRLRVRAARAGESLGQVIARGGTTWTMAQAAIVNGVASDAALAPGWLVKVAVAEQYRPRG
jgi:predicted Zn-dependent protease